MFLPLELVKGELEDEQKFGFNNELIQMEAGETMSDWRPWMIIINGVE